uniref:G-patch domain-containing protein n=1 Tax=Timema cristinae TaxID=61476 RepID=A0A7R9CXK5_TIMCR|nr:unnamed protein product [Timema cristinae]
MLAKMGWTEGQALGKEGDGLREPVALEQVQSNLAPRLCHRQRCNRSKVTLLLVSVTGSVVTGSEKPCSFMLRRYFEAVIQ